MKIISKCLLGVFCFTYFNMALYAQNISIQQAEQGQAQLNGLSKQAGQAKAAGDLDALVDALASAERAEQLAHGTP